MSETFDQMALRIAREVGIGAPMFFQAGIAEFALRLRAALKAERGEPVASLMLLEGKPYLHWYIVPEQELPIGTLFYTDSPAAPTQAEPVYVIFDGAPSHDSGRFVEVETKDGKGLSAGEWENYSGKYWRLGPFYLAPPAAPADMVMVPREVVAFLNGSGSLNGKWFGEMETYSKRPYWWRRYLPTIDAAIAASKDKHNAGRLR